MQNRPNKSKPGEKKINYRGGSYLFYLLAENVSDVIWITELDDPEHVLYVSPSITRLLGYNVAEAMAKTMAQIFTTDSYEYAWNVLREEMVRMKSGEIPQNYSRVLEIELLRKGGLLLGCLDKVFNYEVGEIEFSEEDTLVMFTDGVSEAQNKHGEEFTEAKLESIVKAYHKYNAELLVEKIISEVEEHSFKSSYYDDITIVGLKREK